MQKNFEVKHGDSIENAFIIDAPKSILGVLEEHKHLDRICGTKDNDVKSVDQNLLKGNKKIYDKFVIKMNDGIEKTVFYNVSSYFGKI